MGFASIHAEIKAMDTARRLAARGITEIFVSLFRLGPRLVAPNLSRAFGRVMSAIFTEPHRMMRAGYAGRFVPKAYMSMRAAIIGTDGKFIRWLKGFGLAMYGRFRTGLVDPLIKAMLTGVAKIRWIVSGVEAVVPLSVLSCLG